MILHIPAQKAMTKKWNNQRILVVIHAFIPTINAVSQHTLLKEHNIWEEVTSTCKSLAKILVAPKRLARIAISCLSFHHWLSGFRVNLVIFTTWVMTASDLLLKTLDSFISFLFLESFLLFFYCLFWWWVSRVLSFSFIYIISILHYLTVEKRVNYTRCVLI